MADPTQAPTPIDPSQQPQNPYQMPGPGGNPSGVNYGGYGAFADPHGSMGYSNGPSGPNGPVQSYGMTYGDPNDGGMSWNLKNPGMMDPGQLNPYAAMYMQSINGLLGNFQNSAAGGAFNPEFYQHMQDTSQANLVTGVENAYARSGLSGSSAAMGGVSSAIERNQMDWLNRQQSDQMTALRGISGLDEMGMKDVMGIQGQYGQFQDTMNQDMLGILGVNQQKDAANNQMWGQGLSSVAQIGMAAAFLL